MEESSVGEITPSNPYFHKMHSCFKITATCLGLLFLLPSFGQMPENVELNSREDVYVLNNDTLNGLFTDTTIVNGKFEQLIKIGFYSIPELKGINGVYHLEYNYLTTVKGEFKKGEPCGTWMIDNEANSSTSFGCRGEIAPIYITYLKDTVIFRYRAYWRTEEIFYVNDSSLIYGNVKIDRKKKILDFYCKDSENCVFWTDENDTINRCSVNELDWYIRKNSEDYFKRD